MRTSIILLTFALMSGVLWADPPTTYPQDRYRDLYLQSAITDRPVVEGREDEPNDLPDWTLVAVAKNRDGEPEVRLLNMKDRTRMTIPSEEASSAGFSIIRIKNGRNYLKDTVVKVRKGRAEGEVRFDPKFLVLRRVAGGAAPPRAVTQRNTNNGVANNGRSNAPFPPGARNRSSDSSANNNVNPAAQPNDFNNGETPNRRNPGQASFPGAGSGSTFPNNANDSSNAGDANSGDNANSGGNVDPQSPPPPGKRRRFVTPTPTN